MDVTLLNELAVSSLTRDSIAVSNNVQENGLPNSFVPGRNILFFTLAGIYAYQVGADDLITGVCETDFSGYPDCRNDFVKADNQIKPVLLSFESADYGTPNFTPRYGNALFFLNIIDKLLDREELITLRSKMNMPRLLKKDIYSQKEFWQFFNLGIPLIFIIFFGITNHYIRRKKYV